VACAALNLSRSRFCDWQIDVPNRSQGRHEVTSFRGDHYVECYIIKGGVVVARDRILSRTNPSEKLVPAAAVPRVWLTVSGSLPEVVALMSALKAPR
jgi:hypothetical protein